jgi:hypothetical protein
MPEEELSINEATYSFLGCIFFHVYMKGKAHKYRIKIFLLCEA